MPHLLDGESRADSLARAAGDVLAERGPAGLTIRRVAERSRVSHASVYHQLGSREHLVRVAFDRTARARLRRLADTAPRDLVGALLPSGGDDVLEARAWLAWLEVVRVQAHVERQVAHWRASELAVLARATGYRLTRDQLESTRAMALGLLHEVCQPVDPMSPEDARRVLRAHLELIDPAQRTADAAATTSTRP